MLLVAYEINDMSRYPFWQRQADYEYFAMIIRQNEERHNIFS
jgi:hypothetical protein